MIKFRSGFKSEDADELIQLRREVAAYRRRENLIKNINSCIGQAYVNDELYKTLMLYCLELMSDMKISDGNIKVVKIKEYLENLLSNVEVDVFIGGTLFEISNENSFHGDFLDLYNLKTSSPTYFNNLIGYVLDKRELVELSDVKIKELEIEEENLSGMCVWVIEPLLDLVAGLVTIKLRGEYKYLTSVEKEVVSIFMNIITSLIHSKILIRRVAEEAQVSHKASITDALTKLYNREAYNIHFLYNENVTAQDVYIVYADLCKLKMINTEFGHSSADEVLKALARELSEYATSLSGKAYRLGGDEFIAIIPATVSKSKVKTESQRFKDKWVSIPFYFKEKEFFSDVSLGVYLSENSTETKDSAMNKADELMYISKEERNSEIVYNF